MNEDSGQLIVENLDLQGEWSKDITFLQPVEIDSIFSIFRGKVRCNLITENENISIRLQSGAVQNVIILKSCTKLKITLQSERATQIGLVSVTTTVPQQPYCSLYELGIPIDIKDIKIIHKPEMGYQIAFNFNRAIKILGSTEERKEVEIKNAVMRTKIRRSSENFQWRGNVLFCRLVVGEYKLRMKVKKGEWSEWLDFKCRRPYSK